MRLAYSVRMAALASTIASKAEEAVSKAVDFANAKPLQAAAVGVVTAGLAYSAISWALSSKREHCMSATEVSLGGIKAGEGEAEVNKYFNFFKQDGGKGVQGDRTQTPQARWAGGGGAAAEQRGAQ